jgi:hypothetical protein
MAVALAATVEPDRLDVRLEVTGIPAGADTLTITRASPGQAPEQVRGAVDVPLTGTTFIARDYEAPFNLPLTYTVTVLDAGASVGTATAAVTVTYPDSGDPWLVDLAKPTNSLPVIVESMTELAYQAAVGVQRVLNRRDPVLTSLPTWTPTTELILVTGTIAERDQVRSLLGGGNPFLLRTPPAQQVGNLYLGLTGFVEERPSRIVFAQDRRWRIQAVAVARPDPAIFAPAPPMTYAAVKTAYATYQVLKDSVLNYDELAYTYP